MGLLRRRRSEDVFWGTASWWLRWREPERVEGRIWTLRKQDLLVLESQTQGVFGLVFGFWI
jgi:hypothetical protein